MGSGTKAHPQRWDNFGNRRSAMDRAGKYLTLPYKLSQGKFVYSLLSLLSFPDFILFYSFFAIATSKSLDR
jgi:hypothetical protein